eukprot:g2571.t1
MERSFGSDHYNVGVILAALAQTCGDLGDFRRKKVLLERSVRIMELKFGQQHRNVAVYLVEIAQTCDKLGDTETRDQLLQRAGQIEESERLRSSPGGSGRFAGRLRLARWVLGCPMRSARGVASVGMRTLKLFRQLPSTQTPLTTATFTAHPINKGTPDRAPSLTAALSREMEFLNSPETPQRRSLKLQLSEFDLPNATRSPVERQKPSKAGVESLKPRQLFHGSELLEDQISDFEDASPEKAGAFGSGWSRERS